MSVRAQQANLIREFLWSIEWQGRVLDFGCDVAPYRDIVESKGAEWHGYNRVSFPSGHKREDVGPADPLSEHWDMILCTQVLQYVHEPAELLEDFGRACDTLVLTYATNWPEVEADDLYRYTRSGMQELLQGWRIAEHRQLGSVAFEGSEEMALGYGVVCLP